MKKEKYLTFNVRFSTSSEKEYVLAVRITPPYVKDKIDYFFESAKNKVIEQLKALGEKK